jgi:hypothetical protein
MPAAGTERPTNLTESGGASTPPGRRTARRSPRAQQHDGSDGEIYTMAATGGVQTNITDGAANDADPDWQPKPR